MDDVTKRPTTEIQAGNGTSPPVSNPGQDGVEGLVELLQDMKPYLDSFGRAYCGVLGRDAKGRGGWPLDSEPVVSLLTYRYLDRFKTTPPKSAIDLARMLVIGGLWEGKKPQLGNEAGLAFLAKVIVMMADEAGDFLGSASDAEMALREFVNGHADCLKSDEALPDGPDKLGVMLNQLGVVLLDQGVELYRPRRKDVKRLWAWRKLRTVDDTHDGPDGKKTDVSGSTNNNGTATSVESDAPKPYTPEQKLYMKAYQGDDPHDRSAA